MAKCKCDPEYVKYGFPYIEDKKGPKPQCVVCSEVLAQEGMKPSTLKRHLETKHPMCKDELVEYFRRRLHELRASQKYLTSSCSKQGQALCILPHSSSFWKGQESPQNSGRASLTCSNGHGQTAYRSIAGR